MKKTLNYTKKTISLFLAVLMILSCWVWVAPEKAEAANTPGEGYYYVQVYGDYLDWSNKSGFVQNTWTITYITNNGTGTTATTTLSYVKNVDYNETDAGSLTGTDGNELHDIILAAGWVPGFPTEVKNTVQTEKYNDGCGEKDGDLWTTQPRILYVGSEENTTTVSGKEIAKYGDRYAGEKNKSQTITVFTVDLNNAEIKPEGASVRNISDATITIPKMGSGNTNSSGVITGDIYDQYGVKLMSGQTPDSYYVGDVTGAAIYTLETHGIGVDKTTKQVISFLCSRFY